ncbi:MAG: hypothetical protein R6U41_06690 [Desulfosalsimonas sp.]|uniref:hypothetical protein n=1 Tax=Desulfosalsimonas sp. TaxID=3073848 RepID=UPI00397069D3
MQPNKPPRPGSWPGLWKQAGTIVFYQEFHLNLNADIELTSLKGYFQCVFQAYRTWEWFPRKPGGRGRVFEATLIVFAGKFSQCRSREISNCLRALAPEFLKFWRRHWLNPQKRSGAKKPGPALRASFLQGTTFFARHMTKHLDNQLVLLFA